MPLMLSQDLDITVAHELRPQAASEHVMDAATYLHDGDSFVRATCCAEALLRGEITCRALPVAVARSGLHGGISVAASAVPGARLLDCGILPVSTFCIQLSPHLPRTCLGILLGSASATAPSALHAVCWYEALCLARRHAASSRCR